jgi:hypothetical protein
MRDVLTTFHLGQEVGVCAFRGSFTEATVVSAEAHSNSLGGRWSVLVIRLPDGEETTIDTRQHVLLGPEHTERSWCPECRTTREVEEQSPESHMERHGEVGYLVTRMDCGHTTQGPSTVVGPAPGAPYAGPQVAVAATTNPRDLRHARDRQLDADPWADAFPRRS